MGIHQAHTTIDLDRLGGFALSYRGGGHLEGKVCKGERMSSHSPARQRSEGSEERATRRKGAHRRRFAGDGDSWRQHFYIWL